MADTHTQKNSIKHINKNIKTMDNLLQLTKKMREKQIKLRKLSKFDPHITERTHECRELEKQVDETITRIELQLLMPENNG